MNEVKKEGSRYDRSQINPGIRRETTGLIREVDSFDEMKRDFVMNTDYSISTPTKDYKREVGGINDVLNERGKTYGKFEDHAIITQNMKDVVHEAPSWGLCTPSQKETIEMILHKIGRIVNGDPSYLDSWVDIIGYTQLVVEQLDE